MVIEPGLCMIVCWCQIIVKKIWLEKRIIPIYLADNYLFFVAHNFSLHLIYLISLFFCGPYLSLFFISVGNEVGGGTVIFITTLKKSNYSHLTFIQRDHLIFSALNGQFQQWSSKHLCFYVKWQKLLSLDCVIILVCVDCRVCCAQIQARMFLNKTQKEKKKELIHGQRSSKKQKGRN